MQDYQVQRCYRQYADEFLLSADDNFRNQRLYFLLEIVDISIRKNRFETESKDSRLVSCGTSSVLNDSADIQKPVAIVTEYFMQLFQVFRESSSRK